MNSNALGACLSAKPERFREGYKARLNGASKNANPYRWLMASAALWEHGWDSADKAMQH